ncbi:MAG: hypothetical protein JWO50_450 [Candidatus Kaiserbacteria bacterium]|nr:hypothetical protein [Candidatus Kaiserbacteria bacterium]
MAIEEIVMSALITLYAAVQTTVAVAVLPLETPKMFSFDGVDTLRTTAREIASALHISAGKCRDLQNKLDQGKITICVIPLVGEQITVSNVAIGQKAELCTLTYRIPMEGNHFGIGIRCTDDSFTKEMEERSFISDHARGLMSLFNMLIVRK